MLNAMNDISAKALLCIEASISASYARQGSSFEANSCDVALTFSFFAITDAAHFGLNNWITAYTVRSLEISAEALVQSPMLSQND